MCLKMVFSLTFGAMPGIEKCRYRDQGSQGGMQVACTCAPQQNIYHRALPHRAVGAITELC